MTSTIKEKSAIINVKSEKNVRNKAYFKGKLVKSLKRLHFIQRKMGGGGN